MHQDSRISETETRPPLHPWRQTPLYGTLLAIIRCEDGHYEDCARGYNQPDVCSNPLVVWNVFAVALSLTAVSYLCPITRSS